MKEQKGREGVGESEREKNENLEERILIVLLVVQSITLFRIYTVPLMDPNPIDTEFPCTDLMLTNSVVTNV